VVFIVKIKNFLTSPKTIISLIILTLIATSLGFFVPQITDKSPSFFETWQENNIYTYRFVARLQLHMVYTSYWFLSLVILLMTSLALTIYQMVKRNFKDKLQITDYRLQTTKKNSFITNAEQVFKKRRYINRGTAGDNFIFVKNIIGRWGSTVFHIGLLLIIISALLVVCFQKRGFIQLIEGDLFDGRESSFLVKSKGVLAGTYDTGFKVFLSKLDHDYWETDSLKSIDSSLTVINDGTESKMNVSINKPLLIEGTNVYQSYDYGYTLSFSLRQLAGEEVVSHFNIDRASNVQKYAVGNSSYPKSPYILKMKFMPDLNKKSFYLNKPIVHLTVDEGLTPVFRGLVIPGDAVKINNDILRFTGVRYWSGLIFVNNPGMVLVYIGFAAAIIGLAIMYMLPYKEIRLTVNPETGTYDIIGSTKKYKAIFAEELEEIKKEIAKEEFRI